MLFACAVCGAAEQALPANGAEVAFDGRKRATLDVRAASFRTKDTGRSLSEVRVEPAAAVAVTSATMLGVGVPIVHRTLTTLGDVELRVDQTLTRSVGSHVSFDGGVKLPTAPADPSLPPDLQPGCSSVVPFVGVTAAWSASLFSWWTSLSVLMPFAVTTSAPHPGDSARASGTLQIQPSRFFATRLGAFARWDSTGEVDGAAVPQSGGGSVHVSPQIVLAPVSDLVISFGAAFPVVQAMRAYRSTSPVLLASAGFDF